MTDLVLSALSAARIQYNKENWDPTRSFEDNGLDSLDFMSLLMSVQELFGIMISNEEAETLATPIDLSDFIAQRRTN